MMRTFLRNAFLILLAVVATKAFLPAAPHTAREQGRVHSSPRTRRCWMAPGDDEETPIKDDADAPTQEVKCPNCDLCDGSGRCVAVSLFVYIIAICFRIAQPATRCFSILQNRRRNWSRGTLVAHQSVSTLPQLFREGRNLRTIGSGAR